MLQLLQLLWQLADCAVSGQVRTLAQSANSNGTFFAASVAVTVASPQIFSISSLDPKAPTQLTTPVAPDSWQGGAEEGASGTAIAVGQEEKACLQECGINDGRGAQNGQRRKRGPCLNKLVLTGPAPYGYSGDCGNTIRLKITVLVAFSRRFFLGNEQGDLNHVLKRTPAQHWCYVNESQVTLKCVCRCRPTTA